MFTLVQKKKQNTQSIEGNILKSQDIFGKYQSDCLKGIAIIMISSELNEILNMCDRLCVMNRGTIVAQLERADFVQDTILHYALGGANS